MLLIFWGCKKHVDYPIEPIITYSSFTKIPNNTGKDDKGILEISFTDGDGDIGLAPEDTMYPFNPGNKYYYDFFVTYYEIHNGVLETIVLPVSNNSRIPLVTINSRNKSIKGVIQMELYINNPLSTNDSICFDVSICDRALHESNIIRTDTIRIIK